MYRFWFGLALTFYIFVFSPAMGEGLTDWVNPFVGTANGGNTFPGALLPWGMVSVSPHNAPQAPSGYINGEPAIYGFGHVHLSGTGCPDLGNVLLMPTTGNVKTSLEQWKSAYDSEAATPGYYTVHLKTYDIQAEMTATTRVGLSQYYFPACKGDANIILSASHRLTTDPVTLKSPSFESSVKIVSQTEMEGSSQSGDFCTPFAGNKQTVYFVAQFSKKAVQTGTWKDGLISGKKEQKGKDVGAFFRFSTTGQEPIMVKVGVSYVSVANARLNLKTEVPDWDFQDIRAKARAAWEEATFPDKDYGRLQRPVENFLYRPLSRLDPSQRFFRCKRRVRRHGPS